MYIYVPILKTKQNEFLALEALDNKIKPLVKPLFVLTQHDYLNRALSLTKNLTKKWTNQDSFIDLCQVADFQINHIDHVTAIFSELRNNNVLFTPVVNLDNPNNNAINFIIQNNLTSAILIKIRNFHQSSPNNLQTLIQNLPRVTDIILDFESNIINRQSHVFNIFQYINIISSHIPSDTNIIVAGSSIPNELQRDSYTPYGLEERTEWLGFHDYYHSNNQKNIIFGDYSISHPDEVEIARYVNPNAKIKYTLDDSYLFSVGFQVHSHSSGFAQFHTISGYIVNSPYFMGSHYSWGDNYLYDCSTLINSSTGNMGTWVKVGHNHHITLTARQNANLYGISI